LTIVSVVAFDKVVVYNRITSSPAVQSRIQGATITATVGGQSKTTTFTSSAILYTYVLSSSGLQLFDPTLSPSTSPTRVPSAKPSSSFT
jgi:hypothetical protein